MAKLTLHPMGTVLEISEEKPVLERLREEEIYVRSSCGGNGSCSDCMIKIMSGEDNINPPGFEEIQLLGNVFHLTKERLSCQLKISGDVTIDISHHNLTADQEKREAKNKEFAKSKIKVKKKAQVQEEVREKAAEREEYLKTKDDWKTHWKQEDDPMNPKRLGGAKRPKLFKSVDPEELEKVVEEEKEKREHKINKYSKDSTDSKDKK
ncbi:MAG: ferredoxin [Bacteriovoracaceae bacterium]|jgi:ferredoxin